MSDRLCEKQINLPEYETVYLEGKNTCNAAPVLFLHGWTISTSPYRSSLILLSQEYRVIAPDLPGFGKCTYPSSVPDHAGYVNCVAAFLKTLNIEKVHLIGHSGGGAVAIALAATLPALVKSLTIVDSTGIPLGALPLVVRRRLVGMMMQTPKVKPMALLQFTQSLLHNTAFHTENLIQSAWLALDKDLQSLMPQIQAPTLVLWGERDRFIPLELGYKFAQSIPNAQILVAEGEYHEWAIFRPQRFVPFVLRFLNEIENPDG
ncbi:alpha/beta hydrolase [Phormidium tenue FACHB-886]|nr:alpha/beta hydrolase [Phormidium tenue FACHB-886]